MDFANIFKNFYRSPFVNGHEKYAGFIGVKLVQSKPVHFPLAIKCFTQIGTSKCDISKMQSYRSTFWFNVVLHSLTFFLCLRFINHLYLFIQKSEQLMNIAYKTLAHCTFFIIFTTLCTRYSIQNVAQLTPPQWYGVCTFT